MKSSKRDKTIDARTKSELIWRSCFIHAWDLAGDGVDNVMEWAQESGLNTLCLAGTYHSGWFIHPHSAKNRVFMTEGSVGYFRQQKRLWKNSVLRIPESRLCREQDYVDEVGRRLDSYNLRLVSWTVGCHNTQLGLLYPQFTQQTVYGDRLPHALCPANREVRDYLHRLCRDLATGYPLWGIQLEAFGWMNITHGHHHERDLVGLTAFEQELMSLCFCPACTDAASKAGVEVAALRQCVKGTLDGVFREAPQRPKKHPGSMAEFEHRFPDAKKFNAWRKTFLNSLITSLKQEALAGTDCRLLLQTGFDPDLGDVVDGFACFAFQKYPGETLSICSEAKRSVPVKWNGLLQCCVQLGMGVPESEEHLRKIIAAVKKSGCNGINFYNRSEAPPRMLSWLKNVLPEFAQS